MFYKVIKLIYKVTDILTLQVFEMKSKRNMRYTYRGV